MPTGRRRPVLALRMMHAGVTSMVKVEGEIVIDRFRAELTGRGRVVPMTIQFTEYDRPHRLAERVQRRWISPEGSRSNQRGCARHGISIRAGFLGSSARWSLSWSADRNDGSGRASNSFSKRRLGKDCAGTMRAWC